MIQSTPPQDRVGRLGRWQARTFQHKTRLIGVIQQRPLKSGSKQVSSPRVNSDWPESEVGKNRGFKVCTPHPLGFPRQGPGTQARPLLSSLLLHIRLGRSLPQPRWGESLRSFCRPSWVPCPPASQPISGWPAMPTSHLTRRSRLTPLQSGKGLLKCSEATVCLAGLLLLA